MRQHKNARLTYSQRVELNKLYCSEVFTKASLARKFRVSVLTVRKWIKRFEQHREAGLEDASSRPRSHPQALSNEQIVLITEGRQRRLPRELLAAQAQCSRATAGRVLKRHGLSKLSEINPARGKEAVVRYEHPSCGDLLHIDTKKLPKIAKPGHRVTGDPRDSVRGAGKQTLYVCIDDHSRASQSAFYPSEEASNSVLFLRSVVSWYGNHGVTIRKLLTDNGKTFRSKAFNAACEELGIKHRYTRPYRPQTNGKAERFIQTALREWAYGFIYESTEQREQARKVWQNHYNHHRPHKSLNYQPPFSRFPNPSKNGNNVVSFHT